MAKRKPLGDREFAPYEKMFHKVHQEIKDGRRRIVEFKDADTQLNEKSFYLIDGVMVYLEKLEGEKRQKKAPNSTPGLNNQLNLTHGSTKS